MKSEMTSEEEPYSLLKSYFGIERRTFFVFLALIAGALLVATCIYVAIFGFDNWRTNMARAGSLMIINAPAAPYVAPAATPFTSPNCNRMVNFNPPAGTPPPTGIGL